MAAAKKQRKLTALEQEFLDQYFLNGFNQTRAYKKALVKIKGIKEENIKDNSARSNSCKLKKKLQNEITERKQSLGNQNKDNIIRLVDLLEKQANFDFRNIGEIKNNQFVLYDSNLWTDEDARVITGIKMGKYGPEITFNKPEAERLLAQYRGLLDKDNREEIEINTGLENITSEELKAALESLEDDDE